MKFLQLFLFATLIFWLGFGCEHKPENFSRFIHNGKYGIKNQNGEIIIPPIYNDLNHLRDGLFQVKKDSLRGVLTKIT